jgi:benzodiazapine receptor
MIVASDVAILLAPLAAGLGLPALLNPKSFAQCGRRPTLQPPGYVFGVAWTLLYGLVGVACCLAWRRAGRRLTQALGVTASTVALLVLWSIVFFNVCMPALAFAAILPLAAMVAACIALFARDGAWASAALLVPLGAWMAFASYLSYASIPP